MSLKISWLSNFIAPAISYNGTLLKIVRVSALFQYHPLIKFKSSKKLVNCQTPALFLNSCYQLAYYTNSSITFVLNSSALDPTTPVNIGTSLVSHKFVMQSIYF